MTITHHLDDATLMSLSAGTLGEALSAVASAHIHGCGTCRSRMRQFDLIGGALLADEHGAAMDCESSSVGQLSAAHLASGARFPGHAVRRPRGEGPVRQAVRAGTSDAGGAGGDLPDPLSWIVGKPVDEIPWSWLGPGVSTYVVKLSDGAEGDLRLLKVAANKKLPEHGHGGTELTLIVSGAYRDRFGVFGPGDIADMDEDVDHQPIVEPGEDCICIVACEAPAKFKGPIARLLQPWTGM